MNHPKSVVTLGAIAVLALTGCSKEADDVNKNLSRATAGTRSPAGTWPEQRSGGGPL